MRAALALLLLAGTALAEESWIPKGTADLVLLDKVSGKPTDVAVKVGASTVYGSITVKVRSCMARPADQPADATAFVDVTDTRGESDVFKGWIFANEPGVSQMQHPVYDLKLLRCH